MTIDDLRDLKDKSPFKPFKIHMSDGKSFTVNEPEDVVMHREWTAEAIVFLPGGRFSFIYLPHVTHITGEGLPPIRRRGRRGGANGS